MRLDGSAATSCQIGGLKPATGYVVRIRCKGRHGGGWSSWAKSMPMATVEEQADLGTPLAEDAEARMEAMYDFHCFFTVFSLFFIDFHCLSGTRRFTLQRRRARPWRMLRPCKRWWT